MGQTTRSAQEPLLPLSDLLGGAIVAVMIVYTTEDAYVAFVAGRLTREEFFEVCQRNAEASAESSAQTRGSDQD